MSPLMVLAGYAAMSLLYFLQLPLKGQLPGNTDTVLAIALSNIFVEKVQLVLHGLGASTALHPAGAVYAYGENCAGLGFFFLFFRLVTGSDIWGYYFFISSLFALNAFALFKLAGLFVEDRRAAFLAGVAILFASFTLANIDDPNVIFIFFPVMSWYFLERGIRERRHSFVALGCFLSGLQIWFGAYVFVFQSLALALFLGSLLAKKQKPSRQEAVHLALAYLGPVLPLAALYLVNAHYRDVFSPYDNAYIVRAASLSWQYFLNVLPNNLIYSASRNLLRGDNLDVAGWYTLRKSCFPGVLFAMLSCVGIATSIRRTRLYLVIFLGFLVLSFGMNLPGFAALLGIPFGGYFRVPLRFYLFAFASLSLYFAIGTEWLLKRSGLKARLVPPALALLALIYVAENVPFPYPGYQLAALMKAPREYGEFFSGMATRQVVLDLPSTFRARLPDWTPFWTFSRDALYMNWQTHHRQIIVGGVNGYIPASRARTQEWIDQLPKRDAIEQLKRLGVGFIAFHKNLILVPEENILAGLRESPSLRVAFERGETTIFQLL